MSSSGAVRERGAQGEPGVRRRRPRGVWTDSRTTASIRVREEEGAMEESEPALEFDFSELWRATQSCFSRRRARMR